jgi:hypothetical protein
MPRGGRKVDLRGSRLGQWIPGPSPGKSDLSGPEKVVELKIRDVDIAVKFVVWLHTRMESARSNGTNGCTREVVRDQWRSDGTSKRRSFSLHHLYSQCCSPRNTKLPNATTCWDAVFRPLEQSATSKDRWVTSGVEAITIPPAPNEEAEREASQLYDDPNQMDQIANPDIRGGSIAFVVTGGIPVQEPPFSLACMHAARSTRDIEGLEDGGGCQFRIVRFLDGSGSFEATLCGHRMRGKQPTCGQFWKQEDRYMSVACTILSKTGQSREALLLESNPEVKLPCGRGVIYPSLLEKLDPTLTTYNIGPDPQNQHWTLHEAIFRLPDTWQDQCRPTILPEDEFDFRSVMTHGISFHGG